MELEARLRYMWTVVQVAQHDLKKRDEVKLVRRLKRWL